MMGKIGRRGFVAGAGLLLSAPRTSLAAAARPKVVITTNHGTILVEIAAEKGADHLA